MNREEKALLLAAFLTIAFFATLSGPLAEALPVKRALVVWGPPEETFEDFEARAIMAYHVAAVVVMSALSYLTLRYVEIDERLKPLAARLTTAGWVVAMPSGVVFAYFWRSPVVHTVWVMGLTLMFAAALVILYAMSPWRIPWRGNVLEKTAFFVTGLCLVGSIVLGGIYASHFGFDKDTKPVLLEHHSTKEYRGIGPTATPLQLVASGHAHGAIALWGAAVMLIGLKWVGARGRMYRWALIFAAVGSVITLVGVSVVAPLRPIAHQIIFFGIGPLHVTLFFLWLFLLKRLKAGGWRDPVTFGLFLIPLLTVALVTSTGPLVAMQLKDVVRVLWPLEDEITYNVAHWHMLALLFAAATFFLYTDSLKGRSRAMVWLMVVGVTLALIGAFIYQLSPMFAGAKKGVSLELVPVIAEKSQAVKKMALIPIDIGLALAFIGLAISSYYLLKT